MIHDLPIKNFIDTKEMRSCNTGSIPEVSSSINKKIYLRRIIGNIICFSVLDKSENDVEKYLPFLTLDTESLSDGENDILSDIEALAHDKRENIIKKYGSSTFVNVSVFWEIYFFLPYTNVFDPDLLNISYKGVSSFIRYCINNIEKVDDLLKKMLTINTRLLPPIEKDILLYHKNID